MKNHLLVLVLLFITGFVLVSIADDSEKAGKPELTQDESQEKKSGEEEKEDIITNSIGMKLKRIESGEFMMGSEKGDDDVKPVHKVKITKPFYIGVYEVTQEQYEKIMGTNPSSFKSADRPVDSVSWDDAKEFCKKLSEKEGVTYRLPTEAEWEYACRAGTRTEYYWGDEMDGDYAWYKDNSDRETHPVGKKKPNSWGLYDMSGNVWEWCEDWYDKDYYENSPLEDPKGPKEGKYRVLRGGSWLNFPANCRSACRYGSYPDYTTSHFGFRLVRAQEK